jgi:hypothetical protein
MSALAELRAMLRQCVSYSSHRTALYPDELALLLDALDARDEALRKYLWSHQGPEDEGRCVCPMCTEARKVLEVA